jgi:hypothetical protein
MYIDFVLNTRVAEICLNENLVLNNVKCALTYVVTRFLVYSLQNWKKYASKKEKFLAQSW